MTIDLLRQILGEYYKDSYKAHRYCKITVPEYMIGQLFDSMKEDCIKAGLTVSTSPTKNSRCFATMSGNIIIIKSKSTFSVKNISKFRYKLESFIRNI